MDVRVYMRLAPKTGRKAKILYMWFDAECCLDEIDTIAKALYPLCIYATTEVGYHRWALPLRKMVW